MHIAIIMDWNRRWAKTRFLPSFMWHQKWAENIKKVLKLWKKLWISHITLWGLSDDNITKRSKEELDFLFSLFNKLENYYSDFKKNDCKLEIIWNLNLIPRETKEKLLNLKEKTKDFSSITFTLAIAYWWQDEIIRWIKNFINSEKDINNLTKENFKSFLDTAFLPQTDLIIRTWWDKRTSWFMLYDSPYAEIYFTEKKWPEFDEEELQKRLNFFSNTKRNFWK